MILVNNFKMKAMLEFVLFLMFSKQISADFFIGKGINGIDWHFGLSLNR